MTHTLLRMATAKKCEVDSQNENDDYANDNVVGLKQCPTPQAML